MFQVVIIGSSHVRRMKPFEFMIRRYIQKTDFEWCSRGGSGVSFIESFNGILSGKTVVIVTGGNDLQNGMNPDELITRVTRAAIKLRDVNGAENVIIMGIWPRADRAYNSAVHIFNTRMEVFTKAENIFFWTWSRGMSYRTYDGVHLLENGYRKAARYLATALIWLKRNY